MDDADALRARLAEARDRAQRALSAREAELGRLSEARGDATGDDEHDPEGATLADEWSRLTGLAAAARTELAEIDVALARVDAGWDGRCEVCGEPIPAERLTVRPTAVRCVGCAA